MKNNRFIPICLVAFAVLAGCSTTPPSNSLLEQARSDYRNAQANPKVTSLAAGELKLASDSLDRANNAWSKGENSNTVDHLAYVAKQQVGIAEETARQKAAEASIANATAQRDRVRLEARTREADVAQRNAEISQRQSEAALRAAEVAQRSAEASQRQATTERLAATSAQLSADAARQQAHDAEARTRQLEAQLKELEAKKTDRGMVVTLGDVLFDTNQAQLKAGGLRNVQRLADFLKQYPQRKVVIEGFTDSTGNPSRNLELSENRANSVRTALLNMGIANDRIATRGYGESYPVAGNESVAGRQLNRRVEIVVSDDSGKIAPR